MISIQEQIVIMQAHVDGKAIECRSSHEINPEDYWKEFTDEFQFDWDHGEYRIKPEAPPPPPEPREWFIEDPDDKSSGFSNENVRVYEGGSGESLHGFIKVREVLDEQT